MIDHSHQEDGSIYGTLSRAFPDVRCVQASKATLTVMSSLIEELAGELPGRNVLVSVFQKGVYWKQSRDRYLKLADHADVIAVYSGFEPDAEFDGGHVGVRLEHDFTREWVVLARGPELSVTLCGREATAALGRGDLPVGGEDLDDPDRLFEVIWSYDPHVARHAVETVLDAVEADPAARRQGTRARRTLQAAGEPDVAAVSRAADRLTTELLHRVEQLRLAERRADRRTDQAKTAFLSRMGHELRNPLNAIMGYAQLLELGADKADDTAQRILRAGQHLLGLVDEVLDISQVESGQLAVHTEDLDISALAVGALDLIRTEAGARGVRIEAQDVLGSPLMVRGDRRLIVEVLLNLLSNAIKFNDRGGLVRLTARPDGDQCRIAVEDDGPGIPAEDLSRIFEPFERLPATAHAAGGTGLGLSLSRSMAAAMGGHIDVRSPPGHKTTFTLTLPLTQVVRR